MAKLSLPELTLLALKNHFPLELVPGKTERSHRFHCLVNHPDLPELSLVFGDEDHGYLFDAAWARLEDGKKLRISEADIRELFESPLKVARWTREMPAAENPQSIPLTAVNIDLGEVRSFGLVAQHTETGVFVSTQRLADQVYSHFFLETEARPELDKLVSFAGDFHLNGRISNVRFL